VTRWRVKLSLLVSALVAGIALFLVGPAQGTPGARQAKHGPLPADDFAWTLLRQPDGKLVAGGNRIARYNADGSLDRSFSRDGRVFGGGAGLVLQPDGKLVTAYTSSDHDFALARYNRNGSLDASFGTGGEVTTRFSAGDVVAYALVRQPDGKLVAAGRTAPGLDSDALDEFALARYNPDGSLDASFGTDGTVTTSFGTGDRLGDDAFALVLQPDGKLVAAGKTDQTDSGLDAFALVRYNPNGSLDPTFGTDGKVTTPFTSGDATAYALALQPDGKLVAAGDSYGRAGRFHFAMARYNPDGSLDSSFGDRGDVTTSVGPFSAALALVLRPDGKLVAAGETDTFAPNQRAEFALVRYNPDGSLDTGFHGTGKVTTKIRSLAWASALVLQPNGKLVAAGAAATGGTHRSRLSYDFALSRYKPDGSLDRSFGRGGKVTTAFRCGVPDVKSMKLLFAKMAIRRQDCSVGEVSTSSSSTVGKGAVISQTPKPGLKRRPGTKVNLTVSTG
jgi:uncharacterized delta-60 repeat protein